MKNKKTRKLGPPAQQASTSTEIQTKSAAINGFVVLRFSTKVDEVAFTPEQAVRHAGSMQENAQQAAMQRLQMENERLKQELAKKSEEVKE